MSNNRKRRTVRSASKPRRIMVWAAVDAETRGRLVALAASEQLTLSDVVRRAIRALLASRAA